MTIGALARTTGLRASTIRYYERLGLLPKAPRRHGWRDYGSEDIRRLQRLIAARALGFSLRQLKALREAPLDRNVLLAGLTAKAADIDARIGVLQRNRAKLASLIACNCRDAASCNRIV